MKRMICLLIVVLLCMMTATPAFAAKDEFVPSISYKDGPEIESTVLDGEDVGTCLVVTSIREAEEKTTDILQEERDLLLEIYEQLLKDQMNLPVDEGYIVRELVDVSFTVEDCIKENHGHEEKMEEENTQITIVFDLGVGAATDVEVFYYSDGKWYPAQSVTNNGDGTVTVVLESLGVLAFCVDPDDEAAPPATGDLAMGELMLWGGVLVASGVLLVVLLTRRGKKA